ncbi:hypothetical protein BCR44DRAFT_1178239 [Catenaria anguillulae PL171]|uniref:Uncharacterized protein n=1 Tax=Catenaria anguillulae PL171 TaxID=765915 RepID=A0A1Y2HM90_9FUNG|nr:hypothetical protein BCR44DRAFT_1178239 [Catenaria anguillulae PL171]
MYSTELAAAVRHAKQSADMPSWALAGPTIPITLLAAQVLIAREAANHNLPRHTSSGPPSALTSSTFAMCTAVTRKLCSLASSSVCLHDVYIQSMAPRILSGHVHDQPGHLATISEPHRDCRLHVPSAKRRAGRYARSRHNVLARGNAMDLGQPHCSGARSSRAG